MTHARSGPIPGPSVGVREHGGSENVAKSSSNIIIITIRWKQLPFCRHNFVLLSTPAIISRGFFSVIAFRFQCCVLNSKKDPFTVLCLCGLR